MRRVLFIINSGEFFLSHRLSLAIAARDHGYDVHLAVPKDSSFEKIKACGFSVHAIVLNRKSLNPISEIITLISIRKIIEAVRPEIVHNVTIKPVVYGTMIACFRKDVKVVNTITGLGYIFINEGRLAVMMRSMILWIYKQLFKYRRLRVIFQNNDDHGLFVSKKVIDTRKAVVIRGSGVNVSEFAPHKEYTPYEGDPVVVLAGRMLWHKGVKEYVGAARLLYNRNVKVRFALVGPLDAGNPTGISEDQLLAWNNEPFMEWWGQCTNMVEVISRSSIICLPSYGEGVPKILIEAASCAKPIVATDVPGCREIVQHEVNGLLVPAKDSQALANAIEQLVRHKSLRDEMGRAGREMVVTQFSDTIVNTSTIGVYDELLMAPA